MKKKRIARIMAFVIAATAAAIAGACICYADPGYGSYITAIDENGQIVNIYVYNDEMGEVEGLSYDKSSNTLTMNGYNSGTISISDMGDLTIEVVGDNTINKIPLADEDYAYNGIDFYESAITIAGSGTLSIGTSENPVEQGIVNNYDSEDSLIIDSYVDIYAERYGIYTYGNLTIGEKMHIMSGMDPNEYKKSTVISAHKISFDGDFSFSDGYYVRNVGGWDIVAKAGASYDGEIYSGDVAHEISVIDYVTPSLEYTECSLYCYGSSFQNVILNQDKTFKWSTSNKKIATVTQSGVIKPQKPGTCKVYAKSSTLTLTCKVTVKKPAFDKASLELLKGQSETLKVLGGKGTIKWSSSNKKIAKVNSKGVVTAVNSGSCKITAKRGSYKCSLKVTVVTKPAFESEILEIANGEQFQLKVIGGTGETTYSSDDESIATVDENGLLTGAGDEENYVFGSTVIRGERNGIPFSCTVYNEGYDRDDITINTEPNVSIRKSLGECGAYSEVMLRIRSSCEGYMILSPFNDWDVEFVEGWRGLEHCLDWEYGGYGDEDLLHDWVMLTDYEPVIFATHKNEVYYISLSDFGGSGISGMGDDVHTSKECFIDVKNVAVQNVGGQTKAKAKSMTNGKTYKGVLYEAGDTAWYKFKVTKKKRFKLTISSTLSPGAYFYVYKGKKKLYLGGEECYFLGTLEGSKTFTSVKSLGKGTYYVKVEKDISTQSGYYTVKWKYK